MTGLHRMNLDEATEQLEEISMVEGLLTKEDFEGYRRDMSAMTEEEETYYEDMLDRMEAEYLHSLGVRVSSEVSMVY
jgi:hypothetical protein